MRAQTKPSLFTLGTGALLAAAVLVGVMLVLTLDENGLTPEGYSPEQLPSLSAEILRAAQEGNADAQFRIGKYLLLDTINDKSKATEALQWLQQAAENGSTEAMVHLGRLYRTGLGALQNYGLAARWIQRAASSGDSEGMLELGRLYRDGIGMEQDPMLAYVWLNRAAAALNMEAANERDSLARSLTYEQLRAAQDLSAAVAQVEPESVEQAD